MTASLAQYRVVISLGLALTFAVVSLALGFGLGPATASGFIGAASGLAFCRQPSEQREVATMSILKRAVQSGGSLAAARPDIWLNSPDGSPRQWGQARKLRFVLSPFFLGSSVQRVAAAAFLTQAAIGLAAIPLFRAAQAAGIDVQLFDASPLAPLFADAFPFRAGASVARVRFDHLFLPLVSLYAITMPLFGLVFLRALGPIVRDFRAKWKLLFVPLLVFSLWVALTYRGSSRTGLQDLIVDGNAWGYFFYLVFCPLLFMFFSAGLPNDSARQ